MCILLTPIHNKSTNNKTKIISRLCNNDLISNNIYDDYPNMKLYCSSIQSCEIIYDNCLPWTYLNSHFIILIDYSGFSTST